MNKLINITSVGRRVNLVQIDDLLFGTPYTKDNKWYCSNCNKEIIVPIKKMNEICECGVYINWLSFIWNDNSESLRKEYMCEWSDNNE